ncbi:hypothetical protein [Streptomyces bullii]|uniref:HTH deoR-type domain-containing protein n=1 Tax=Streptomyces bullii TaxID=349910 RepID=A0ABW0UKE9_9ACTN
MSAAMELHVALSLRLDAVEAYRLAHAYRAEVLSEADARLSKMQLPEELQGTFNAGSYADAWRDCRAVVRAMAEETHGSQASAPTVEAYDGELAMLRGLVRTLRTAARWGCIAEVQKLLWEHARDEAAAHAETGEKSSPTGADATPADTARQADLLTAIRAHRGRWKSGRALRTLRQLGFTSISKSTASHDLSALAAAGHLTRFEEKGVRWYELAQRGGHRA